MSYIPDVRKEFIADKDGNLKPNPYFEGFLNENDAKNVESYDYAVEQVDNFFNNLDAFEESISRVIDLDKINLRTVFDDSIDIETLSDEDLNEYSKETIIVKSIRDAILIWLELERDSMIVSLIDSNS